MVGAAGGAILGAAIGVVSGGRVLEATGKGAAIGGAGGRYMAGPEAEPIRKKAGKFPTT
jgi:hypothetical protein